MLWLSLYFPALALEVFTRGSTDTGPMAVYETHANRSRVIVRNRAAKQLGIELGMSSAAAQALAHELILFARNQDAEDRTLSEIAAWAGQFTPTVSLLHPAALLLEIEGSLTYFGGLQAFLQRVRSHAAKLGFHSRIGMAPTPLGSYLFAKNNQPPALSANQFRQLLSNLALDALDLPEATLNGLKQLGLRRFHDCLDLPRAGLTRRFGQLLPDYLDRILGVLPDPRPPFIAAAEFHAALELPSEVDDKEALLFAANRLLQQLAGFLSGRGGATQNLLFRLQGAHESLELPLRLINPNRNAEHFLRLLRERLEHTELPEPIRSIALDVTDIQALAFESRTLFSEHQQSAAQAIEPLLERLNARLGSAAVHGLKTSADHRPEFAHHDCAPAQAGVVQPLPPRPIWLLTKPQVLTTRNDQPCLDGVLQILRGPERIESGWWDGGLARDYYVANNSHGARLWIFRERKSGAWYWHGLFA